MSAVSWSAPQKINGRTRYACTCSCGRVRWLVKKDARYVEAHQSPCFTCSQTIKAKKGFQANVRKYGWAWAIRHVQMHQLEHPQPSEMRLYQVLSDLGLEFVPQYWLATKARGRRRRNYLIDAMVVSGGQLVLAIEINGGVHHAPDKQRKDRRKLSLLKRRNIPALVMGDNELESASARIADLLGRAVPA